MKTNLLETSFSLTELMETQPWIFTTRRAESVQQFLVDNGIDPGRIGVRGYGRDFPVATNSTEAGRLQNRRVEVVISEENMPIPERGAVTVEPQ